jgi:hypothetical protein
MAAGIGRARGAGAPAEFVFSLAVKAVIVVPGAAAVAGRDGVA